MLENTKYIISSVYDAKGAIEFERSTNRITQVASILGKSLTGVSTVVKDQAKAFKTSKGDFEKHTITFKDLNGQMQIATGIFKNVNGQWVLMSQGANLASTSVGKLSNNSLSLTENLARLASRAMLTIPVWLALRGVVMGAINAFTDLVKTYQELEAGMQKVMAVAQYTSKTQAQTYAVMEQAARKYYATSIAGMKDITEAMYELGSAGRSNAEMIASLKPIMDLAIGSYTDVKTIARAVAGVMNVFGKEFEDVGTKEEQLTYITNLLGDSWKRHQIEVSEIVEAYKYLGATGAATGINFKTFLAAVGNLGDDMLRSGKAGRNLASAIADMAKNSEKLKDFGIKFDPRQPLDFVDIMEQLRVKYVQQGESLANNAKMQELFGQEGSRAIVLLLEKWDGFLNDLDRTKEKVAGVSEELKNLREKTWGGIFSKFWRLITTGTEAGKGSNPLKDMLDNWINDVGSRRTELAKRWQYVGSFLADQVRYGFFGGVKSLSELLTPGVTAPTKQQQEKSVQEINRLTSGSYGLNLTSSSWIPKNATSVVASRVTNKPYKPASDIDMEQVRQIRRMSDAQELQLRGYSDQEVALREVSNWMDKVNATVDLRTNKQFTLNQLLNQDVEALEKAGLATPTIYEGLKKVEEYQKKVLEDAQKYADILSGTISESLQQIMGGEGWGVLSANINKTLVDNYRKEVAGGISRMVMSTGIGDIFGGSLGTIKGAFGGISEKIEVAMDRGGQMTYNWIIRGFNDARSGTVSVSSAGVAGWSGTAGGADMSSTFASLGLGSLAAGGKAPGGGYYTGGYTVVNGKKIPTTTNTAPKGLSTGQKAGYGVQGALTGYSAYQSARAGGIPAGQALASGLMTGVGSALYGGALASSMAAGVAMGPVGWIGLGIMALGMAAGLFGGKKSSQSSIENKTTETKLSSKIDVTNKNLEIINRNLLALKSSIETYILPSSAYFAEKRGIEDQFALFSRRGFMG